MITSQSKYAKITNKTIYLVALNKFPLPQIDKATFKLANSILKFNSHKKLCK